MGRSASDGAKTAKLAARISRPVKPVPLPNELASSDGSDDGRDMVRPPSLASRIGRVAAEDDVQMAVEVEAEIESVRRGAGSVIEVESDDDIIFDAERSYSTAPLALLRRPLSMRISSDPTPHAKRPHPVSSGPVDPEEMAEQLDAILNPRRRAREERHRASLGSTPTFGRAGQAALSEGPARGLCAVKGAAIGKEREGGQGALLGSYMREAVRVIAVTRKLVALQKTPQRRTTSSSRLPMDATERAGVRAQSCHLTLVCWTGSIRL